MSTFKDRFFNYWLPDKVKANKGATDIRYQIFIWTSVLIFFLGVLGIILSFVFMEDENTRYYHLISSIGSIPMSLLLLIIIKKTGSAEWAFNLAATIGLALMGITIIGSGGIFSSSTMWIAIFPVTAFFLMSKRTGVLWTVISILFAFALFIIHLNNGTSIPQTDSPLRRISDIALVTIYISFILYIYENNRNKMIARMKNAHLELKKQNISLKDLNRENETLMAIMAHDLKAPQNQLQGIFSLIKLEAKDPQMQGKYIDMGKDILSHSLHMIDDITYSKEIRYKDIVQNKEEIQVSEYIKKLCEGFELSSKEKNIRIVQDLHYTNGTLLIDKNILGRIVQNLISNAIKFSPFGKSIFVRVIKENNQWLISIKDEGPGISEEDQKQLFKRFQKLSARPTNKESSSGLGLYIVKMLTERIGGRIELISEEGHGAEFRFTIPAS